MGLFKRNKDAKKQNQQSNPVSGVTAIFEAHMNMALSFYEEKNYGAAFDLFKLVAENTDNSKAQYNLGSLYAQGLGTEQEFIEAAYWFNRAYKNGEEGADKLTTKCLLDYANVVLRTKTPKEVYESLSAFSKRVYNTENCSVIVRKNLLELGTYYFNTKKDYAMAAKLFRAGAEYENDGWCQNYLAVLYNAGAGVEKNDLASLYWFDKASEQGVDAAKTDRDGMLNAYINNLGKLETAEQLRLLAGWCTNGTEEAVPIDEVKAVYWKNMIAAL